jgi:hypothetical protein
MAMLRVVAVAFVMNILMLQPSWSETAYDRQGDVITPGAELWEGVLDRINIDKNEVQTVIINDTVYRVDADTKAKTASGRTTGLSSFKPGTNLEFYALDGLLTKVMPSLNSVATEDSNDPEMTAPNNVSNPASLHKEDGVWKN